MDYFVLPWILYAMKLSLDVANIEVDLSEEIQST